MTNDPADGNEERLSDESTDPANGPNGAVVVGLTGPNASGKGEAADHLVRMGFTYHSLSDVVREEATARGLTHRREDLIAVGNDLRARHGFGILAERIVPRLSVRGGRNVVDSIRNPREVDVLRRLPFFLLLGVTAPIEVRFDRARARGRIGDGESLEEFRTREEMENSADPWGQQLAATLALADHIIYNVGSVKELQQEIAAFIRSARI
jgi:dephospho-CoA kinase